jgi:tetratricopeptide (TPR) repeat protein
MDSPELPAPAPVTVQPQYGDAFLVLGMAAAVALAFGLWAAILQPAPVAAPPATAVAQTSPEGYLDLSLSYYSRKKFPESIQAAREALRLRPDFPEAWNNIAAASAELGLWDDAISAAQQALRLRPDFPLARNNLAWAQSGKAGRK